MVERSLRRLARKISHLAKADEENPKLLRRIRSFTRKLARIYPELLQVPWSENGANQVLGIADERAKVDRLEKLARWQLSMEDDESIGRRWVKRAAPPPAPTSSGTGPVHP